MILADTSIWIDHLRKADPLLIRLLTGAEIVTHRFVIGEIALGHLNNRWQVLSNLANLPECNMAGDGEVLTFIKTHALQGSGIGYLDAHLLASITLTPGSLLWTRDKKLRTVAAALKLHMKDGAEHG